MAVFCLATSIPDLKERLSKINEYTYDSKYFLRPDIVPLINSKTCIYKRLIDIACIIHNQMEFILLECKFWFPLF